MTQVTYSKRKVFDLFDLFMCIICIFPIATSIVDTDIINKVLYALLLGANIILILINGIKKNTLLKIFILILNFLYVVFVSVYPLPNVNMIIYFPYFLIYTYFICERWEQTLKWLKNNKKIINFIVIFWTLLVGISVFFPSSYYIREGGASYFGSFVGSIFRLGPPAVFIQVLVIAMQVLFKQRKAILYMILPLFCCFMGSSRSYLVVGVLLFLISWYIFCENKKLFNISLIPILIIVLVFIAETSIGAKIEYTLDDNNYGDFWFRVSSSRSQLWVVCMTQWWKTDFLNQLFGSGFGYTAELTGLWAHNDYIEILCSFGILGLIQYIAAIISLYKVGSFKKVKMPFIIKFSVFMIWFFNAFFNMHYTYFCAMICYPFLIFVLKYYFNSKQGDFDDEKPDLENCTGV